MLRGLGVLTLLLAAPLGLRPVAAQVSVTATPVFHGFLDVTRAYGTIARPSGTSTIRIPGWNFVLVPDTNGIFPDQEPIVVALSQGDQSFTLEAGQLKASRSGRRFSYRAPHGSVQRGIRMFRLWRKADGSWEVRFTVAGVDLSRLNREDPICTSMAVIVGDDDGFVGVNLSSPTFLSHRLVIPSTCDVGNDWPWLRG